MNDNINFIRDNIDIISHSEICKKLNIHCRTLYKIINDNNIIDDRLYRFCPSCKEKIYHKNKKQRIRADKDNRICNSCSGNIKSDKYSGTGNPFYGKHHTEEIKKCYREIHKGKRYSINTEFKKGHNKSKNRKSTYYYWVKKYGEKIANEKLKEFKDKISKSTTGINNPMYGRISPIGSGNGWSGWYKGWYFRSLIELSYMIYVIQRFNISWESGEKEIYKIPYIFDNNIKNYYPDFILNKKYIIECKPKNLWNSNVNKEKFKYAKIFADSNNMIFKLVNCRKIKIDELISLYNNGEIKLIEKYEKRINIIINK